MKKKNEFLHNHIEIVMGKMFEAVGLDYLNPEVKADYRIYDKDSEWYTRCEWTEKQQVEFIEWLTGYLMGNSEARRALMAGPWKNKRRCYLTAMEFTMFYGWKTKKEEK